MKFDYSHLAQENESRENISGACSGIPNNESSDYVGRRQCWIVFAVSLNSPHLVLSSGKFIKWSVVGMGENKLGRKESEQIKL